ncbi:MAG: CoB--CoM heterodisulfide reductase iron-sulfur subunit B family protein [Candidatus Sumerlaeia bacterium]|nr:CoB--CoM heterodisulfide reductase iron-sulfur subunit B family protein [Candidatus Sumerlaeia bacterium]
MAAPTTDYAYFPGCSLESTGIAYDKSLRAVFRALGLGLHEIDDWNCCGATAYMSVKETVSFAISARNLALAERQGPRDIVAPCSACFLVLAKTRRFLQERPALREKVDEALAAAELSCECRARIRHPLEVLVNDVGIAQLRAAAKRSLRGHRFACYYGCQMVRPERYFEPDREFPMAMDDLFRALGAATVDYPLKVRCCGGMQMVTNEPVGLDLTQGLLDCAVSLGATAIVTTCPMCQFNLELYQDKITARAGRDLHLPVLFFTQPLGLALGCDPAALGFEHQVVPVPGDSLTLAEAGS